MLPPGTPFPELYRIVMDGRTPVAAASLYLIIVYLWTIRIVQRNHQQQQQQQNAALQKPSSPVKDTTTINCARLFTLFVLAHNLALAAYSGLTFYKLATGIHRTRTRDDASMFTKVCDTDEYFWNDTLGYWGYFFYLSKFYEFVDTFIILLKGRKPSLLQEYHHAGAIITMWAGIRYHTTAIWMFVTFNSFIHTAMYSYYAATTLGLHPPGKKYLTSLQIAQFLLGMTLAAAYLFTPGCSELPGEKFTLKLNLSYLMPLTWLFFDFARKTYGRRQKRQAVAAAAAAKKKAA
ncbi:fatty acid elongase [Zychaea mexicana]|uniref:fatty acid elongase n=1 Tax=Zychaea mexicana TaxID=64656 RepID=UPI0022FDDB82|nr:fatty acid elongase [Zychaea mexicana]KAI9488451.1 fatty acid elongase [Zychaea mexicana]